MTETHPSRYAGLEGQPSPEETLRRQRDGAILRVLRTLDYLAGPVVDNPPNYYRYIYEEFRLVTIAQGLDPDRAPAQPALPTPDGTQYLVPPPPSLTPEELDHATAAVWEHDGLTHDQRREAGMPISQEGYPITADVEACLSFLDDQDPRNNFSLQQQAEETTECTFSCRCWTKLAPIVRPEHRRAVLDRDGERYDPPGTSPRNRALREVWRQENNQARNKIRRHGRDKELAHRGTTLGDNAAAIGAPQAVKWEVNPLFVQSERDVTRNDIGLPTVVDPRLRPLLERGYVLDATTAHLEAGYIPQHPHAVLDHTQRTPLEPLRRRRTLKEIVLGHRAPSPTALEGERAEVKEQIQQMLTEGGYLQPDEELPAEIIRALESAAIVPALPSTPTTIAAEIGPSEFDGMTLDELAAHEPDLGASEDPDAFDDDGEDIFLYGQRIQARGRTK